MLKLLGFLMVLPGMVSLSIPEISPSSLDSCSGRNVISAAHPCKVSSLLSSVCDMLRGQAKVTTTFDIKLFMVASHLFIIHLPFRSSIILSLSILSARETWHPFGVKRMCGKMLIDGRSRRCDRDTSSPLEAFETHETRISNKLNINENLGRQR